MMVKTTRVVKRATNELQLGCFRGSLSTALSACLGAATYCVIWLSGVILIEDKDVLGLQDLVLLMRYVFLAFVASNVILPPMASAREVGPKAGCIDETIGKVYEQSGCDASPGQLSSLHLMVASTDSQPAPPFWHSLSTSFSHAPCPCENSGLGQKSSRAFAETVSSVVTI
eukprot:TRINITY_DN30827_c0_g1_i3.p1 TRINITY_DN30827_c0_g1~~TRINITY_DN30827_c0_g1_i3.p1  ORF type:complete len:171 (+),score=1.34 TRINITY_DN30827_c0_g1_i3:107-619(+)